MQIAIHGRRRAAALAMLLLPGVLSAPSTAQEPPADTIAIIKDDEAPSNAEVAMRLSEETRCRRWRRW